MSELAGSGLSGTDGRGIMMEKGSGGVRSNLTGPSEPPWEVGLSPWCTRMASWLRCGLWPQAMWVRILSLSYAGWVTSGKLLKLFVSWCLHLGNWDVNRAPLIGLL